MPLVWASLYTEENFPYILTNGNHQKYLNFLYIGKRGTDGRTDGRLDSLIEIPVASKKRIQEDEAKKQI